jgi:hypothetical protein
MNHRVCGRANHQQIEPALTHTFGDRQEAITHALQPRAFEAHSGSSLSRLIAINAQHGTVRFTDNRARACPKGSVTPWLAARCECHQSPSVRLQHLGDAEQAGGREQPLRQPRYCRSRAGHLKNATLRQLPTNEGTPVIILNLGHRPTVATPEADITVTDAAMASSTHVRTCSKAKALGKYLLPSGHAWFGPLIQTIATSRLNPRMWRVNSYPSITGILRSVMTRSIAYRSQANSDSASDQAANVKLVVHNDNRSHVPDSSPFVLRWPVSGSRTPASVQPSIAKPQAAR